MDGNAPHNGDDPLLVELAEALRSAGPVPERMRTAARAAFEWWSVDEELDLLVLAHDSALADGVAVRDAAPDGPRELGFQGGGLLVEIEVGADILGQLVPPQPGRVALATAQEVVAEAQADAMGCFRLPLPGRGPVRLVCRTDTATVATEWMPL